MVGQSDDPKIITFQVVDDAVRKASQREAPAISAPDGRQLGKLAEQVERSLELANERLPQLFVAFSGVVDRAFSKLSINLRADRRDHLIAARARAIAAAAGMS